MMFWLISSVAKSQIYNPNINSELSNLKGSVSLVEQFESFGIKAPGSQEKTNTFITKDASMNIKKFLKILKKNG